MRNRSSVLITGASRRSKRSGTAHHLLLMTPGILVGILLGLSLAPPCNRQPGGPSTSGRDATLSNVDLLCPDEIQILIVKALSKLGEQQGLTAGGGSNAEDDPHERAVYGRRDVELGVENIRRLLPSAKHLTIEALHDANVELKPSDWPMVTRLIEGVCKIVRNTYLRGMAAVRDDRLSEILVDPSYAPYLTSDDEALFVLAHELTHVVARSGKLTRFIEGVAENVRRAANVEAKEDQKEDLACDFVGELVLTRFIVRNPTNESTAARVSRVIGYESPTERFARAWEDFRASYNGDPGDEDHLNQHQTICALVALDSQLQSLLPMSGNPISSLSVEHATDCR